MIVFFFVIEITGIYVFNEIFGDADKIAAAFKLVFLFFMLYSYGKYSVDKYKNE